MMCLLDKNNVATDAATDNAMDATTDEFLTSRRYCSTKLIYDIYLAILQE